MPETMQYLEGNGETFVWMVDQPMRENNLEIYSPEFVSAAFRYTFRIKVRLNGPNSLNAGSMSCGLNLRSGPHDDEIAWPFSLTFTGRVVDVMGQVVESATTRPSLESDDSTAIAFQRPEVDNTLSRGWGNFLVFAEHNMDELLVNGKLQLELHLCP
eukprot:c20409_g1_i4.p1 GENE.c20409_g1_i4~~c20409_g1_i4.p1  ORF type:complete len:157 (+),score=39.23 c20409_g1_i4:713-1183(+)